MTEGEWKFVSEYGLHQYANGLKRGNRVRLLKELVIRYYSGQPTGEVHGAGEVWTVLSGVEDEPDVVWLRDPNGDSHTWDLDDFFEWFQIIDKSDE